MQKDFGRIGYLWRRINSLGEIACSVFIPVKPRRLEFTRDLPALKASRPLNALESVNANFGNWRGWFYWFPFV